MPIIFKSKLYPPQKFIDLVHGDIQKRLEDSAKFLQKEMKKMVSVPFPPPSAPLEPPHKRTGRLQKAIEWKGGNGWVRVGVLDSSKCWYTGYLELGTSRMSMRPFIRPALIQNMKKIMRHIGRPIDARVFVRSAFDRAA